MKAEEPHMRYAMSMGGQFYGWRKTIPLYSAREVAPSDHFMEFIRPAAESLDDLPDAEEILNAIAAKLRAAGWQGDGAIGLAWVPPFAVGRQDDGYLVFHVKQANNGATFIAEPAAHLILKPG